MVSYSFQGVVTTILVVVISVILLSVEAHVTLTFPPARKLDIDFLNNL